MARLGRKDNEETLIEMGRANEGEETNGPIFENVSSGDSEVPVNSEGYKEPPGAVVKCLYCS